MSLFLEIALRISDFSYPSLHRPDDRLGLRLRENAEGWSRLEGGAFVKINSAGFRDRERQVVKPSGIFRIAVLGDSYTDGLQVDLDKTFPALLEQRLNACNEFGGMTVEVLNFGVDGYGTAQELLTYRYFTARYSPDVVLLAFFAENDVRNNSRDLEPEKLRPFFLIKGDALVEDRSFARSEEFRRRRNSLAVLDQLRNLRVIQGAYFIRDRINQRRAEQTQDQAVGGRGEEAGIDDAVYSEPSTQQWRDAWVITERLLAQLKDEVQRAGARLIVVVLSTDIQVDPDGEMRAEFMHTRGISNIFYPDLRIAKVAANLGIHSILLAPRLQEIARREKLYFHGFPNTRMGTGHWNEAGHRLAAEVLAGELCGSAAVYPHAEAKDKRSLIIADRGNMLNKASRVEHAQLGLPPGGR